MKNKYQFGVEWIAREDEPTCLDEYQVAGFTTVLLLADLLEKEPEQVAKDIVALRRKWAAVERKEKGAPTGFLIGAEVLIDGHTPAVVADRFFEGSTSYPFPHYKVHFVEGERNVAVNVSRVGVVRKEAAT